MGLKNQRTGCVVVDQAASIRPLLYTLLVLGMLLTASPVGSQLVPGSMDVHWNEGASDCARNSQSPLQVHPYNPRTFILRENPCATFEAPFMYLLLGSMKALLIDTGDLADRNASENGNAAAVRRRIYKAPVACSPYPSAP